MPIGEITAPRRRPEPSAWGSAGPRPVNPHVWCGSATCRGVRHERNEDSVDWAELSPGLMLLGVADGVGGNKRGDRASKVALRTLFSHVETNVRRTRGCDPQHLPWLLKAGCEAANRAVRQLQRSGGDRCSTTLCTALVLGASHLWIAHAGDSRGYLLRDGWLRPLTRDHSLVNQLLDGGSLSLDRVDDHPARKYIVRAVGRDDHLNVDLTHLPLTPHDAVLLCSDGLWGSLDEDAMARILRRVAEPEAACQTLVSEAIHAGARDDVSAVAWASRL